MKRTMLALVLALLPINAIAQVDNVTEGYMNTACDADFKADNYSRAASECSSAALDFMHLAIARRNNGNFEAAYISEGLAGATEAQAAFSYMMIDQNDLARRMFALSDQAYHQIESSSNTPRIVNMATSGLRANALVEDQLNQ